MGKEKEILYNGVRLLSSKEHLLPLLAKLDGLQPSITHTRRSSAPF